MFSTYDLFVIFVLILGVYSLYLVSNRRNTIRKNLIKYGSSEMKYKVTDILRSINNSLFILHILVCVLYFIVFMNPDIIIVKYISTILMLLILIVYLSVIIISF